MNIHQVNVEIPCQIGYDRVDVGLLNRPHDCTHPVGDGSKPSKKEQNDLIYSTHMCIYIYCIYCISNTYNT